MSKNVKYRKDGLFIVLTKPKTDKPFDFGKMLVLRKSQLTKESRVALFGKEEGKALKKEAQP